jgi:LPS export ABC transporter permease LptG/LPS export ABC transporter permease LptF
MRRLILARALTREVVPPLLLAAGVTTFLLLINNLFKLAELFISGNVPGRHVFTLLLLALPSTLVLTLPIGTLFAVLMTTARWSGDSELIALQACGIPLWRVARPLIAVGVVVFAIDVAISWYLMPAANRRITELARRFRVSAAATQVESRMFIEDFPSKIVYVDRVDRETRRWTGILLFDLIGGSQERLITAHSGELAVDAATGNAWLKLQETTSHDLRPDQPGTRVDNREQTILLTALPPDRSEQQTTNKYGARETSSQELLRRLNSPETPPSDELEARIELHTRVAFPAAALAFAFVGFPLGIRNRRGGKGYGLTVSVVLIVVYYILLRVGEAYAGTHTVPVGVAMWLPNLAIAVLATTLMVRAAQVSGPRSTTAPTLFHRLRRLLPGDKDSATRSVARPRTGATVRERQPFRRSSGSFSVWRLGLLDRYLLWQCLGYFLMVVLLVCSLAGVVKLSEKMDSIRENHVPVGIVVSYLFFELPQILHDVLPLAFLIAFLGTATVLERHNETTALKACGVSLSRVAMPLLGLGVALGGALLVMDEQVTQRANRASQKLHDVILARNIPRSYRATDRLSMFLPDGRTLVNFLEYDPDTSTLARPTVYVFDERMNLRARYLAARARYADGHWPADGAVSQVFTADGGDRFTKHPVPIDLPLPVGADYFGREYRKPAQMSFRELRGYISTLRAAGYKVDRLRVQLHQKLAYPMSLVILAWISLPYAFRAGRRGAVVGVALAIIFGMLYYAMLALATRLGEVSWVDPVLASWTPTVVFGLIAILRHQTLRT